MILNSIRVFITLFLIFAACLFGYQAGKSLENKSDIIGNLFCFVEMVLAVYFIWRR